MFKNIEKSLTDFNKKMSRPLELLSFGSTFLDDALGGISSEDLIIMSGKTGTGKTEYATQIAMTNALANKKVYFFALEAGMDEITARIKYKMLTQAYFIQKDRDKNSDPPNYQDWVYKKQNADISKFEPEIDEIIKKELKNLYVFYRNKDFTIESFESQMHRIGKDADLIIMDHLHYFDFEESNENAAVKKTVKQIRELQAHYGTPIILVVHLRKYDKKNSGLLPTIEDIHGSSDIAKIATKAFMTAQARDQIQAEPYIYPTYFRIVKNRMDSSRCFHVGVMGFNMQKNCYETKYRLGELDFENTSVKIIETYNEPYWSRKRIVN